MVPHARLSKIRFALNLIKNFKLKDSEDCLTNLLEQPEPSYVKVFSVITDWCASPPNYAPPILDAVCFEALPAEFSFSLIMLETGWVIETQQHGKVAASQRHNALIHDSWKGFATVYNMLSVHPETCHSNERRVRAAKSQEVGSQRKVWYWCATPKLLGLHLWQKMGVDESSVWIWRVTGLYSDSWLGKQLKMGIYLCIWDLNSHSQSPNHRQGSGSRFSLVEQSQIAVVMAGICSCHSRNTTKMKSGLLGFGCIFVSVFSLNVTLTHTHTHKEATASNFTSWT